VAGLFTIGSFCMGIMGYLAAAIMVAGIADTAVAQDAAGSAVSPQGSDRQSELRAIMGQQGAGNAMTLLQSGRDNQARMEQDGDHNTMSAVQNGAGNRLSWRQTGSDLPDLRIVQSGAAQISIIQTR
jgi:hypothetical protein